MNQVDIPELEVSFSVPDKVEEMTQDQYLSFIDILSRAGENKWDEIRIRLELIYIMMPISHGKKKVNREGLANMYRLAELFDSYFVEKNIGEKLVRVPRMQTAKSIVREFKHKGIVYAGPDDAMSNASMKEFISAFYAFQDYQSSRSMENLVRLAAILYRPKASFKNDEDFTGDYRIPFNPATLSRRVEDFQSLPKSYMVAAVFFFEGFLDFLKNDTVRIGGNDIRMGVLFDGKKEDETGLPSLGFLDVIFALAETSVFGNKRETENENMWEVFSQLYRLHVQNKRHKMEMDKMKLNRRR